MANDFPPAVQRDQRFWKDRWLSYALAVLVFSGYLFFFAFAYWLAFAFRYDFNFEHRAMALCYQSIAWVVLLKSIIFFWHRHFNNRYYYTGFRDALVLFKSAVTASIGIFLLSHYVFEIHLPRTVPVLDGILTFFLIGSVRFGLRILRQELIPKFSKYPSRKTLIIGANFHGASLAHELHTHPKLGYKIAGFVSIHEHKIGQQIGYVPILGHVDELENVMLRYGIQEVLTSPDVLNGKQMRAAMTLCQRYNVRVRIVPSMENRLGSDCIPMRDIKIEDLLRREPVELDDTIIKKLLTGKRVLVTGAGGSIGSEICRQIIKFQPQELFILGRGENRIFFLEHELKLLGFEGRLFPVIADVTNMDRMEQVFQQAVPDVVFHAAAHKHVPLMEANITEAVHNNIRGTKTMADLAHRHKVATFVLISTDKAVNPTSVMGASKHLAERYVQAMSRNSKTQFITTRFGNVLGSNGSVVPIFKKQIALGGPITITDFRMTRYFMTIPEAAQLVLQAAAMGSGGEIFVLDMGEPVKIVDLAKDLIRLAGLPETAIDIIETGMRPGEKLYEELYFDSETAIKTSHKKLRCASHRKFDLAMVEEQIAMILNTSQLRPETIRAALQDIIEEYNPHEVQSQAAERPKISLYTEEESVRRAG